MQLKWSTFSMLLLYLVHVSEWDVVGTRVPRPIKKQIAACQLTAIRVSLSKRVTATEAQTGSYNHHVHCMRV